MASNDGMTSVERIYRMCKNAVVTVLNYYLDFYLKGLRKPRKLSG